jgi:crossover junction endodeoxyribonuclease RusA
MTNRAGNIMLVDMEEDQMPKHDGLYLELPWPPSKNVLSRAYRGRIILSKKAREYYEHVLSLLNGQHQTITNDSVVVINLFPPDRRKRDVHNYLEAIFDALEYAKILADDSLAIDVRVVKCGIRRPGMAAVTIKEIERGE